MKARKLPAALAVLGLFAGQVWAQAAPVAQKPEKHEGKEVHGKPAKAVVKAAPRKAAVAAGLAAKNAAPAKPAVPVKAAIPAKAAVPASAATAPKAPASPAASTRPPVVEETEEDEEEE